MKKTIVGTEMEKFEQKIKRVAASRDKMQQKAREEVDNGLQKTLQ